MIKRSTYILIITFVAILFVWMQMLMLNLIWSNNWVVNSDSDNLLSAGTSWDLNDKQEEQPNDKSETLTQKTSYYVIAPTTNNIYKNVTLSLKLLKISYQSCRSLDQLPAKVDSELTGLIICEGNLDKIGNFDMLLKYAAAGTDIIFAALMDTSAGTFRANYTLFGIDSVFERYEHEDIDFLDNMLATGTVFDVEIKTYINKLKISGRCRTYACASEDASVKYYDRVPVLWRTYYENGAMYFVNMDILEDFSFAGIFVAILGLDKDVFAYPIINTRMILIDALPFFSNENSSVISDAYSRDIVQFQRDILWGDLTSMMKRLFVKFTYYPHVGTDQTAMETKLVDYYAKEITLNECEWGYYPSNYFSERLPNYYPTSAMHYELEGASNKTTFNKMDFGYINKSTVSLPIISQGSDLNTGDIFKAFSIASAFGYVCHYVDMKEILLNPTVEDLWTKYKLDLVQGIYPITKTYDFLEADTASEGAKKMDIYLKCETEIIVQDYSIEIKGQDIGEISYILRTNRELTSFKDCTLTKIKNNVYKVTVPSGKNAFITTRDEDKNIPEDGNYSALSRAIINWFS